MHRRLLAEIVFLLFAAIAGLAIWSRISRKARIAVVVLLALLYVGYRVWRHLPPYEDGVHDSIVQAGMDPAREDTPHIGACKVFPADNVWNTPIDSLPKDPHTQDYIDSIGGVRPMHPDFGASLTIGIPYSEIGPFVKRVRVTFDFKDDSDLGNYPIPPDAPIEGGANAPADADRHVILVDQRRCVLYEIYNAHKQDDGTWQAGSGIKMDLTSNALRDDGKTSADAAGLPILPGLIRYDEVMAGEINHALRFTAPHTQNTYVWPARHKASRDSDKQLPPMGERFRLRADFDISKYSKTNQVIMKALKKYGMFLADNGGAMFISGVSDKRWDDSDLHRLGGMKAEDFEAVDESGWQFLADSARVDPTAVKP